MSLINKMLKDLEKRGAKPPKALANDNQEPVNLTATEEASAAALQAANTDANQHTVEAEAATITIEKKPSRVVIYGLILLAVYLVAYMLLTQNNDRLIKQAASPVLATTYQPKAVTPLHQSTQASVYDEQVAHEIKSAIEAEIQTASTADENDVELDNLLSEAKKARREAIANALTNPQNAVKQLVPKQAVVTQNKPNKKESRQVLPTRSVPTKVAKVMPKPQPAKKPSLPVVVTKPVVKPSVKVAKAPQSQAKKQPIVDKTLEEKLAEATVLPIETKPVPKVVTAVRRVAAKPVAKAVTSTRTPHPNSAQTAVPNTAIVKTVRQGHKATAKYSKALKYVQQGRVSEAQTLLAEALELDPEYQDARQTLAALLLDNKRIKEARNVLKEGLVVTPNHTTFRIAVARLEVELGNPDLAVNTLLAGKKSAINHASYQAFLATLLQGQNRHEEAITHFQNALNSDGSLSNVLIGMGVSLQALDRLEDAKVAFEKAQYNTHLPGDLKHFLNYRLKEVEQKISAK